MLTYTLIAIIVVLCASLYVSVRRNLELDERFEEMGDQVEESLDILDGCYKRISVIAETPVASDDPMVQQLIQDVKYTKHAILLVANKVVTFDRDDDEGKE